MIHTSSSPIYVIDSCSLITPFRNYYNPKIIPTFLDKIQNLVDDGKLCTIDKVKDEIMHEDDSLAQWFRRTFSRPVLFSRRSETDFLFRFGEKTEIQVFSSISSWILNNSQFKESAKERFLSGSIADPYLVAFCKAHNLILITEEKYIPDIKRRIPIPNVCQVFAVRYMGILELLVTEGIQFK